MVPTIIPPKAPGVATFLVFAGFLVLSLPLAYLLNIWQDEAYSLHTSGGSIANALRQGLGFEAQAPLYFILLEAWRHLNPSAFCARLLSIAFSIVTLAATLSFARRYIANVHPAIILAAIAFNPFTIWAAVEIRPYAAAIAFSALLLLLLFRGYLDERPSFVARVAYIVVAVAGTYTQYYVAFLLPAHLLATITFRQWIPVKRLLISSTIVGLSIVPFVAILPQQLQSYHAFAVAFKIPSYAMAIVLLGYPYPHGWIDSWAHEQLKNGLYLLVAITPIGLGANNLARVEPVTKALVSMLGALFAIYTFVIIVLHVHVIIPRHTLVMLVPLLVACWALIGDINERRRTLVIASYGAIYSLFTGLTLWHDYSALSKTGDWHRVSDFVTRNARPGDAVAIFNAEAELPFRYYFHAPMPVAAIPRTMDFDRFDERRFVLHGEIAVAHSFEVLPISRGRIWLIETAACAPDNTFFGCIHLKRYVDKHFKILETRTFNGTTVLELKRSLRTPRMMRAR